ncbi:MAG: hypothetical protein HOY71_39190, partial [Nonomuraea sp.]|nr:hypothetical protein [Nonomuraea sp.]
LATARGRRLETWDVRRGRRIKVYEGAGDQAMAFSPDGSALASGTRLLDLRTGAVTPIAPGSGEPTALAFSPDGRTLALGLDGGRVELWDVRARERAGTVETGSAPVRELRFSPGGDLLAVDAERTRSARGPPASPSARTASACAASPRTAPYARARSTRRSRRRRCAPARAARSARTSGAA